MNAPLAPTLIVALLLGACAENPRGPAPPTSTATAQGETTQDAPMGGSSPGAAMLVGLGIGAVLIVALIASSGPFMPSAGDAN